MSWIEIGNAFLYREDELMLFHQGLFLFIFSGFLIAYSFVSNKNNWRQYLIIAFSAYFYYKASGVFVMLLLLTVSADYVFSVWMEKTKKTWQKQSILTAGILFSLSFLFYFKYKNFFIENVNAFIGTSYGLSELILPIGISFYTFQSISYLVDIYGNKVARPPFYRYLMYMMFFPHLVAGPIVRDKDFLPQLDDDYAFSNKDLSEAIFLILKGLVKKVIIADFVAQYPDIVFSAPYGFSGSEHFLASLCYSLQIFCDFSGYTDMAIGIALLLGYRLGINFSSPYKAMDITEFWRRWHISLSSWLRDHIYIPLGGNRKGFFLQLLFLLCTMLVGGFWHGADWKFVFWGAAHGFLLVFHKVWLRIFENRFSRGYYNVLSVLITFFCVNLLWIPFRANSIHDALYMYSNIFTNFSWQQFRIVIENNQLLFLLLVFGYVCTIFPTFLKDKIIHFYYRLNLAFKLLALIVVIQLFLQIKTTVVQPFIYFQF